MALRTIVLVVQSQVSCSLTRRTPGPRFPLAIDLQSALEKSDHFLLALLGGETSPLIDAGDQALDPIDVKAQIGMFCDWLPAEVDGNGTGVGEADAS